jgi:hypothetical protein
MWNAGPVIQYYSSGITEIPFISDVLRGITKSCQMKFISLFGTVGSF